MIPAPAPWRQRSAALAPSATALAALCAVTALAGAPAGAESRLTIGISQFPTTFHPSFDAMLVKSYILGMARRPITAWTPDWELTCLLCTALPDLEQGTARLVPRGEDAAGIAVTYTLPEGARWADGTPLTVRDVLFTWEVGRHPETGFTNFELFRNDILDITTEGERRFTVQLDKALCEYQQLASFEILPDHVERPAFAGGPAIAYRQRTLYAAAPTTPGLWFGPYRLAEVQPGASVILDRNPHWWGEPPAFDRIIVKAIPDSAALQANLLAGDIDMIAGEGGITLDEALALEGRAGGRFRFVYKPGLFYEHVDLNLDNPVLADARVRRALLLALDREQVNRQLFAGKQPVAHSSITPLDSVYSESVPVSAHDPAAAAALLEEAGWTAGPGGIRRNAAGEALRLSFATTAGNRSRELVQQVLQAQWRAVGIDVRIENQPPRVLFGQSLSRRTFEAMALYSWISAPRNIPRTTLHSSMIPSADNAWAGQNYPGYRNERVDQILEDLETVCEPEPNLALWAELQERYATDLPALPLFFRADAFILPPWLENLRPTGHLHPSSLWIEHWRDRRGG